MQYLPEPPHEHGAVAKLGVLLINLGTPQAPTAAALRAYLKQFLWDPRVVEIPRPLWWLILHGIVLNTRPRKSAEKYAKIWTTEGSPLRVHTERQANLLRDCLAAKMPRPPVVAWAMRYGQPSVAAGLAQLKVEGCRKVLVVPLYPQYAASSTASAFDAVFAAAARMSNVPELSLVKHFHDHPGYIDALAQSVRDYWTANGRPEQLVMSFHGIPRFALERGDPYHCECQKTGRLLAEALSLDPAQYVITFQSRFGRAEWLRPYTLDTVEALGRKKTPRIDVICPGFVADCLETLEEIAIENKAAFLSAGGGAFHYVPCLNERAAWIEALASICFARLESWGDTAGTGSDSDADLAASRQRALALGASR